MSPRAARLPIVVLWALLGGPIAGAVAFLASGTSSWPELVRFGAVLPAAVTLVPAAFLVRARWAVVLACLSAGVGLAVSALLSLLLFGGVR
jgi:hypothetical protein